MLKFPDNLKELTKSEIYQLIHAFKPFLDDTGKETAENAVGLLNLLKLYDLFIRNGEVLKAFNNNKGGILKMASSISPEQIEQVMKLIAILNKSDSPAPEAEVSKGDERRSRRND
ncbi:MAG: hypothetical protein ACM3WV_00565 [Bacillota bacterium]